MASSLIALTGLIYFGVAADFALKKQWEAALVYVAYALANVGWYLLAKKIG